ncbi:hypothetical protein RchiOBHm_Chr1g0383781 [Rosa chinensis]|uniref:Uncharacterized protein n=1 Tax=Rosa chinensis TaxID=74649 RepID=A0A2P6SPS2_ROSCH|nr:hypothetical protein RchiOBHm_Chr1g0383781 [Rosa chinensis]
MRVCLLLLLQFLLAAAPEVASPLLSPQKSPTFGCGPSWHRPWRGKENVILLPFFLTEVKKVHPFPG